MKRPKYHQSEIETFLKCGKQWEFRYVQGIKTPPKAALTLGSSVDAAVTKNLIEKVQSGADLPVEAVVESFASDFERRKQETEWGEEDPGEQKDMGVKLVTLHHTAIAPKLNPATVQETFHIETDAGYDLGGTIDLTEKSGVVVDTKTSKKKYEEDSITRALQPAMYDFAYEALHKRPAEGFRYDVLVKPSARKLPAIQQIQAKVTEDDRLWLFDTLANVHKAISAGVAIPAPANAWWCSKDWCGYWGICKGRKR